jgi:hypothetical protein
LDSFNGSAFFRSNQDEFEFFVDTMYTHPDLCCSKLLQRTIDSVNIDLAISSFTLTTSADVSNLFDIGSGVLTRFYKMSASI